MDKYTFVHTKSLDGELDTLGVGVKSGLSKAEAEASFRASVRDLMEEFYNNEFLHGKAFIHKHKALIIVEGVHHVVAITKEDEQ